MASRPTKDSTSDSAKEDLRGRKGRSGAESGGLDPQAAAGGDLLALQRAAGNQAVGRLLLNRKATLQRHPGPTMPAGGPATEAEAPEVEAEPEPDKMAQIRTVLGQSPAGISALAVIDKYSVPVNLQSPGPGSTFQGPAPGKIDILSTKSVGEAAFTLVHEAQHAKASNEGTSANVQALGRAEYVKATIDEETTATVNAIRAKLGMSAQDQAAESATPVMMARYQTAYGAAHAAVTELTSGGSFTVLGHDFGPGMAEAAGKAAGWQSVNEAFYDGSLVTSNTGQTYADYYGSFWDRVNNPPEEAEGI
jgi:hypothetical protein